MKVALYARVSTDEQNAENQLERMRSLAEAMSWEVYAEYVDIAPGGDKNRPEFKDLLASADTRKFDIVIVWSLDRFSREGILETLSYIKRLKKANVALKSVTESWLDTRDEGMGELLLAIFSWVAQRERERISARTKAGLRGKKNVGKRGKDKKPRKRSGYLLRWSDRDKVTLVRSSKSNVSREIIRARELSRELDKYRICKNDECKSQIKGAAFEYCLKCRKERVKKGEA